jgi:hypothetical protein
MWHICPIQERFSQRIRLCRSAPKVYRRQQVGCEESGDTPVHPSGRGVQYLHRDPESRRRRRKRKSQIWQSKIWSWVPRDLYPRKTTLARVSSIYKRQKRPLWWEGAPEKQDLKCQRVINIWSWALDGVRHQDLLIDWPSVEMWLWLWLCGQS